MSDVLIYGDTIRCPELRHEVPLAAPDPFLYLEHDGRRHVVIGSLEVARLEELGADLVVHPREEFGLDELVAQGLGYEELGPAVSIRAVRALGVTDAIVPATFPLALADPLREQGVTLRVDVDAFVARRRTKNAAELAGIRRAQAAAEAGMRAAAALLRQAESSDGGLVLAGEPLTSERIKLAIEAAFTEHGCTADEFIVASGPQGAVGHDMGSGPIVPGAPVVIDLWPRDRESGCFADMTRTFVVGEPSDEIREYHRLALEALERSMAAIRPGVPGRSVFDVSCEVFEGAGQPTQRTKKPGEVLQNGFFHGLGHGVGLEVHEAPWMGRAPGELAAGDVVTVEPGCYRQGYGGVRLEDLVLVTEDGVENLTRFPYDLAP